MDLIIIESSDNNILSSLIFPIIVALVGGLVVFASEKIYTRYNESKELLKKLKKQYNIALYNVYTTNQLLKLSNQVVNNGIVSELYFSEYESHEMEMIIYVDEMVSKIRNDSEQDEDITLQVYSMFKDNLQKLSIYKKLIDEHIYEWKRSGDIKLASDIQNYYKDLRDHTSRICVNVIILLNHFTIVINKRSKLNLDPYKKNYCNEVFNEYRKLTKGKK